MSITILRGKEAIRHLMAMDFNTLSSAIQHYLNHHTLPAEVSEWIRRTLELMAEAQSTLETEVWIRLKSNLDGQVVPPLYTDDDGEITEFIQ